MAAKQFKRKLSAVFSADAVGYSRMMGKDEAATVEAITACREIMYTLIRQHRGRVVDSPGDNLLAEFGSVVDAVQCAVAVQKEFQARNAGLPENRRMRFRIGINLGDIIEEDGRIYGDGVNIAARLEALADPGGICISKTAFDHIETKLPLGYEYLGDQTVKNISRPVGAYRVMMEPRITVAEEATMEKTPAVRMRRSILAVALVLILTAMAAIVWYIYPRSHTTQSVPEKETAPSQALEPSAPPPSPGDLDGKPHQTDQGPAPGPEAHDLTLRGLELLDRPSRENNLRAMELFQRAVELDPGYVEAWVNLAWTHLMASRHSRTPAESFKRAVEIARKAVAMDQSNPEVHALLGNIHARQNRYDLAVSEGRKAVSLGPENPRSHLLLAITMNRLGKFHEAITLVKKAMALNPHYPAYYLVWLGSAQRMAGQYHEALRTFNELLDRSGRGGFPAFLPHLFLAETYAELGQHEKAQAHGKEAERLNPRFSLKRMGRVVTCGYKDQKLLDKRVRALRKAGLQ